MFFYIPPIRLSKKCNRCYLRYPRAESECIHCKELTDREVEELLYIKEEEALTNKNIGKLFILFAIVISFGILILNWDN